LAFILFPSRQGFGLYAAVVVVALGAFMRVVGGDSFDLVMAAAALVAVRWLAVFIHENFRVKWGFRRRIAA
ncbi:MAG TPA: hypothetical protein VEZ11_13565, partial [Thermoanaerobaculia bacterium]|nr:hypothetical protein [Thermoanaerobaculia bacterium]